MEGCVTYFLKHSRAMVLHNCLPPIFPAWVLLLMSFRPSLAAPSPSQGPEPEATEQRTSRGYSDSLSACGGSSTSEPSSPIADQGQGRRTGRWCFCC